MRLLKDKDLLVKKGSSWELREGAEVPFPDSVQALIAARLDTLSADTKSMLADAAVVGKVFWAGAVAQMGERDLTEVTDALRELSRKELVRPARRSSIEGEAEYAFWHILARDVAYAQLPRASRASRHVAAARWIESKAPRARRGPRRRPRLPLRDGPGARPGGRADRAGDRARGTGAEVPHPGRGARARPGHRRGARRTSSGRSRSPRRASRTARGARPLRRGRPPGRTRSPRRPRPWRRRSRRSVREAISPPPPARWARSASCSAGSGIRGAGRSRRRRSRSWSRSGRPPSSSGRSPRWPAPMPSRGGPRTRSARRAGARALAEELGLAVPRAPSATGALARSDLGDPGGLEDNREAIELATEAGQGREVALLHNNLGCGSGRSKVPGRPWRSCAKGSPSRRPGGSPRCSTCSRRARSMRSSIPASSMRRSRSPPRWPRAWRRAGTCSTSPGSAPRRPGSWPCGGRPPRWPRSLDWLESAARGTEDPQLVVAGSGIGRPGARRARAGRGRGRAARRGRGLPRCPRQPELRRYLPAMVRTALAIGDRELAERLVDGLEPRYPYAEHALVAANAALTEARGDLQAAADAYADAADRWERFGVVPEQAFALLGQGRCLLGLSRPTEAAPVLQTRSGDLRAAPGGPRARGDRRAPAAGDRAQLVTGDLVNTWSRSRRNPTVLPGTPVTPRNGSERQKCWSQAYDSLL